MTDEQRLTRRRLLELGLAVPPLVLAGHAGEAWAAGDRLRATPSCDDETPEQTEGPFYTPQTPRRRSIVPAGAPGTRLTVTGRVLTTNCRPIPRALLDFWQANARGVYDNEGFQFRGHQRADAKGRYRLETVLPGLYTGRTRHIHVKVQAPGAPVLTTQLYFPGVARNQTDGIFDPSLLVKLSRKTRPWTARFDFVFDI